MAREAYIGVVWIVEQAAALGPLARRNTQTLSMSMLT
jgi:hypothetical protein